MPWQGVALKNAFPLPADAEVATVSALKCCAPNFYPDRLSRHIIGLCCKHYFETEANSAMKQLIARGRLQFNQDIAPGEYVLETVVVDTPAKGRHRTAAQWIDFEIVR